MCKMFVQVYINIFKCVLVPKRAKINDNEHSLSDESQML